MLSVENAFAQFNDTTNYYTNLTSTGIINKTNDRDAYLLNNSFKFAIYKNRISFNSGATFIYGKLNNNISNRDFNAALDFNVFNNSERLYYWGLASYESSFSLKINGRGQTGAGVGYLIINKPNAIINISDGPLYEYSDIATPEGSANVYETVRNSLRLKFRFIVNENLTIDGTHFAQHALRDRRDYILRSNTTIAYRLLRWLSFTSSVTYNKLNITGRENLIINFGLTFERYF